MDGWEPGISRHAGPRTGSPSVPEHGTETSSALGLEKDCSVGVRSFGIDHTNARSDRSQYHDDRAASPHRNAT